MGLISRVSSRTYRVGFTKRPSKKQLDSPQTAMAIDKTKRPLRVPPQFQLYAEEHGLFDLYHRMLQRLVIVKPEDPLQYMIDWLQRESDAVPKIAVIGAPASGKASIARKLAENSGAVLVDANKIATSDEEIVSELKDRLTNPGSEPLRRGLVLNNMPSSRKQALLLQQWGFTRRILFHWMRRRVCCWAGEWASMWTRRPGWRIIMCLIGRSRMII